MAKATSAGFSDMVLEVEFTALSGVYSRICGLTTRGIQRQSNMASNPIPDCDDETVPSVIERAVESQEASISASGVWASESHGKMLTWWGSGSTLNVRVHHVNAASGEPEYETGAAFLTQLGNTVDKGSKVTADISIEFNGVPTITNKA